MWWWWGVSGGGCRSGGGVVDGLHRSTSKPYGFDRKTSGAAYLPAAIVDQLGLEDAAMAIPLWWNGMP